MSLELAKAYIRVRADAGQLTSDLQGARKDFTSAARSMGQAAGQSIAAGIQAGLAGVLTPTALFTKGFLRKGLAQAAEFEQTTIAFNTMLGSAKETSKLLGDLTEFAAKTPFEMPEILQATRGLIQFGERGEELMESLNLLGNAASGTSTPFGMLALIFNQVRGVGKLLTQDFRQMSTRGVLSLQDIAKHFKVTTAEAQNMLSTGRISFEDLKAILRSLSEEGGRFYKLMELQSKSLSGLQSTLSDAWNIMARQLATALIPAVKGLTSAAIKAVEALSSLAEVSGEMASGALVGAASVASLGAALSSAALMARIFGVSLKGVFIGSGIAIAIIAIGAALGVMIQQLSSAVKKIMDVEVVNSRLGDAIANLKRAFYVLWESIKIGFSELRTEFQPVITAFEVVFRGMAIWAIEKFNEITLAALDMAMRIGIVLRNIKDFSMILFLEMQVQYLQFKVTAMQVWHDIMVAATSTVLSIMIKWQELIIGVKTVALNFKNIFITVWSTIWEVAKTVIANIITAFGGLAEHMPAVFKAVWDAIKSDPTDLEGVMRAALDAMTAGIADTMKDLKDPAEVGAKTFAKGMANNKKADTSEEEAQIFILKKAQDKLNESVADTLAEEMAIAKIKERQKALTDGIIEHELARRGGESPEKDPDKPPPPKEDKAPGGVDAGRFRIEEFGNIFQDAVLKGEDQQVKMVGLLEQGNKLQEQQLEESKKNKSATLTGDGADT